MKVLNSNAWQPKNLSDALELSRKDTIIKK